MTVRPDALELNRNARALLSHLYDAHVKFAGQMFTESHSNPELAREFGSVAKYHATIKWLVSKNLAEHVTFDGFTITEYGWRSLMTNSCSTMCCPCPYRRQRMLRALMWLIG